MVRALGLMHLPHAFPTAFVVLLGAALLVVAHGELPPLPVFARATAVILLSQLCVGALNDFIDREIDAREQPHKPIPAGMVPARAALAIAAATGLLLPLVAAPFGSVATAVAVTGLIGGVAYDLWLKPTPFALAGYLAGFLSLVTFVWLVAGRLTPWFLLVAPVGSGLLLAAYLANSYPDVEIDQRLGHRGLAPRLGAERSRLVTLAAVGIVISGGLALAIAVRLAGPTALFAAGAAALVGAAVTERRPSPDRAARLRFFRVVALACGLSAAAAAMLLRALSG